MPAEKTARAQERRWRINRITRSSSRTLMKKAERLIGQEDPAATAAAVTSAISALDRAAHKGVIHPNNAARRKSRLARKANKAMASG